MKRIMLAVVGVLTALALTGCTVASNSDEIKVHKGGGLVEAAVDKGCVQPAQRELQKPGDDYYPYPAGQRWYKFSNDPDADGGPFNVVSKDNQTLTVVGTLYFSLNQDCDILQKFHDEIGNRNTAYFSEGMQKTPDGWRTVLNTYMRPALDATVDRVAKQYTWVQLYSDPTIKDELNQTVNERVRELINQQLEGDYEYFVNYSAQILQPIAPQELVDLAKTEEVSKKNALNTEAKAKADAVAAQAAAEAQVAQKTAELKVKQLEAQIEAAKIAPFGSAREYNNYLAIQKGLNPYQPQYGAGVLVDGTK